MAELWNLASSFPGLGENLSQKQTEAALEVGNRLVPDLVAGRFDKGLAAARGGRGAHGFRPLVNGYRPPANAAVAQRNYAGVLVNAEAYQFNKYVAPKYLPLALAAHIEGRVELKLSSDPETGEVQNVSVISGHPLLKETSVAAAKQWRFAANSVSQEPVTVAIEYRIRCE